MKKLLLPSIIATLTIMPAFATTPTTLPNNALCNETNLGTESGSADIEVVWEPNTINTQWFTGYGENTAAASATTCEYGGTINLPAKNPSRPGYAFAGWKLRASQCTIPSQYIDTSLNFDEQHARWKPVMTTPTENDPRIYTMEDAFGTENSDDLNPGEWVALYSYGEVRGVSACADYMPNNLITLYEAVENEEISQQDFMNALYGANGTAVLSSNTSFSGSGDTCFCKVTKYTPVGGQQCNISSLPWVMMMGYHGDSCENGCARSCVESPNEDFFTAIFYRRALYGVQ